MLQPLPTPSDPLLPLGPDRAQVALHDFLRAELLHSLGAYALAARQLKKLDGGRITREISAPWAPLLANVVIDSIRINENLRLALHKPADLRRDISELLGYHEERVAPRHPHPEARLTENDGAVPSPVRSQNRVTTSCARFIVDFYRTAAAALGTSHRNRDHPSRLPELREPLTTIHDPHRRPRSQPNPTVISGRRQRYLRRAEEAAAVLQVDGRGEHRTGLILDSHLGLDDENSLVGHILAAFDEAHRCMHRAEHHLSHSFGDKIEHARTIDEAALAELERSVVLNTFAYVAPRIAPWAFAETEAERDHVLARWDDCCERLTPTYCMWLPRQISLLALHRRAYAYMLMRGRHDEAYRDFHKLVRFLRAVRPDVEQRAVRAPGSMTFVDGLTAIAEHHTGSLYRNQHAHGVAVKYFERASARIERWTDVQEIDEILVNSRWRIHLLVSHAKALYELGRVKESLLSYARAWHALLALVGSESRSRPNFDVVNDFMAWLMDIRHDPDINKRQLRDRILPLVRQFETILGPSHLRLLASDIILRIGHVLFVLKLPDDRGVTDNELAQRCMIHAASLDKSSTLIAADLRRMANLGQKGGEEAIKSMFPIATQWPSGGGRFEEAARVIEYILQTWLGDAPLPRNSPRPAIARRLLTAYLAHTDSSNVKLAQVYRYLAQDRHVRQEALEASEPSLDLVCLRRYSSFFPFLPRPLASRAPGGGYLIHVHEGDEAFGVAIDPGPDFAENLYRCGYGLADIDMIVVTHDHADHMASLDALLALIGYRRNVAEEQFTKDRQLVVVGNPSVCRRYEHFNDEPKTYPVRVAGFDKIARWTALRGDDRRKVAEKEKVHLPAATLQIDQVATFDHRDGGRNPAQGLLVSVGRPQDRASVLFTSDTGPISPSEPDNRRWRSPGKISLADAVKEARVVVAHLSSVPLRELRVLAGLESTPAASAVLTESFRDMWKAHRSAAPASTLLQQVEFAFRSQPADKEAVDVTPLSPVSEISAKQGNHLFLTGILEIAEMMHAQRDGSLLVVGELREELGSFRTRIAHQINDRLFTGGSKTSRPRALTGDIGLKIHLEGSKKPLVQCTTCDLDNDLIPQERLHGIHEIREVCVKGEDEAIFYNCATHDPAGQDEARWLEAVERYDLFGR